ncbi:908_t:CDS:10, partial [Cetraspora pellucida]
MDVKQEREAIIKTILKNECDSYLYEYLIRREEQTSFTEEIRLEYDGYLAELHKFKNDPELGDKMKITWDSTPSGCSYDDPPARQEHPLAALVIRIKFSQSQCVTEKKSPVVFNFWINIQKSREEKIAVRNASLGHLSVFGASVSTELTQYARAQEESNEGVKLPARRKQENTSCITNVKKSRVNGQDSQLDNDSEQSRMNIQDSRLKNYSEQSPFASVYTFSDHNEDLEDETNYMTISSSIESQQLTNDNNNEKSSELLPHSDNREFDDIEEIIMNISKELEHEPTAKWKVGCINVFDRFLQYQKEVFKKAKKGSLKHANIYEFLALSSILVLCWPCPYSIFTNREWREIMNANPYIMNKPLLPQETSSSLREAASRRLSRGDVFMECGESDLNRLVTLMFNNLYYGIPEVAPSRLSKKEHCDMFIYPIVRSFRRSEKEYELRLNRTTAGSKSRPDLSCVVNDVLILNSEFKPLGCTPLQEKKDRLKAHLKAHKSINQQLEQKGGSGESAIFLNIGSSMDSYFMDLKYDGLYHSWSFLTTNLVIDKNTIPLAEFVISHLVALEERVEKIAVDFKYRNDKFTPPLQMSFLREFPNTPQ